MSKTEAKFKIGQPVHITEGNDSPFGAFEAHIAAIKVYNDDNYYYDVVSYCEDGSISVINFSFAEKYLQKDEARNDIEISIGLEKDLRRNFEIGDPVIVDIAETRKSIFEDHKSLFWRGTVTGIFLDAVRATNAGGSFWSSGIQIGIQEETTGKVDKFSLVKVQYDWNNPGHPEIQSP